MIKYFCDRCGEEVDKYSELFTVTMTSPPMTGSRKKEAETGTYILCYDCIRELNKLIERITK